MTDQNSDEMPSNEEIINNLTEKLEKECSTKNGPVQPEPGASVCDPDEPENSDGELDKDKPPIADDFVDEEALKELESTLSEEELQKRRAESASMKIKANETFRSENFIDAIKMYTDALHICPLAHANERAILYCNRAAAKIKLDNKLSAIEDCSKALELDDKYIRAYMRRAKLYEETEKLDESLEDYKKVLELDPSYKEAQIAAVRLPPLINERNEKLKTEMIGKFSLFLM